MVHDDKQHVDEQWHHDYQHHDYWRRYQTLMAGLLWTIIVILVVIWLIGFLVHVGGGLIHLILVIAVILLIVNLLSGRGARV